MDERWGPLAALSGTWEGDAGVDVAFRNVPGTEAATPFREHTTFTPFGPVINGTQHLFGLDYRTTAWPGDAPDPFHSEIGYWLWDGDAALVMRCFTVPRGATVLAPDRIHPETDARIDAVVSCDGSDSIHGPMVGPSNGERGPLASPFVMTHDVVLTNLLEIRPALFDEPPSYLPVTGAPQAGFDLEIFHPPRG